MASKQTKNTTNLDTKPTPKSATKSVATAKQKMTTDSESESRHPSIINFDKYFPEYVKSHHKNINAKNGAFLHPSNIIICGPTGCGKTNWLLNCLLHAHYRMTYSKVILLCPTLNEPSYQFLQKFYEEKKILAENHARTIERKPVSFPDIFVHVSSVDEIPDGDLRNLVDNELQNLLIVDDFVTDKKINKAVEDFCKINRKINTSLIYLSQSWFAIPKFIRMQVNNGYACLFGVPSMKECTLYAQEFSVGGLDAKGFKDLFKKVSRKKHVPLVIDFLTRDSHWMFRAGFEPIGPESEEEEELIETDFY